jgi:hypothetical protein
VSDAQNVSARPKAVLELAAIGGAVITLVTSIAFADMVGWLPASADKIAVSPFVLFALYLLAYLLSPVEIAQEQSLIRTCRLTLAHRRVG